MRRFLYATSFAIAGTLVLNTLASAQQPAQGSTAIIQAATDMQPELGTLPSHTSQELQLEVFINDVSTGLLGAFEQARDGHLSAKAGELKELGLRPPKGKGADDLINLNDLAGVSYHVVSETQMVYIEATDAARLPKIIDANPTEKPQPATASTGAVLNYSLFSSTDNMLDGSFDAFRGEIKAKRVASDELGDAASRPHVPVAGSGMPRRCDEKRLAVWRWDSVTNDLCIRYSIRVSPNIRCRT